MGHHGFGVGKHFVGGAVLHDFAVFHDRYLVGDGANHFHFVGDDHDGDA